MRGIAAGVVWSLLSSLWMASAMAAVSPETALRASTRNGLDGVGASASQLAEWRRESGLGYDGEASGSTLSARGGGGGGTRASRPLTTADLGVADDAVVEGTFGLRDGKATAYVKYLGAPTGGLGDGVLGARSALRNAARADGATRLRIETSPVIEETGRLAAILRRAGFAVRPNGTMYWEGGL